VTESLISPSQLMKATAYEPWLIFDVRHDLSDHQAGRRAYEQGHIPGAKFLDHEQQLSAPRTGQNGRHPLPTLADLTALMRGFGLRPESRVVVYDASGGAFAAHLWWMLRWMGHQNVAVLDGGWPAWIAAGGQVEVGSFQGVDSQAASSAKAQSARAPATPVALAPHMPMVDADIVLANLDKPAFTIIDARAAERYRGEVEPMDPVAGHIPGALNRPNSLNLQADGRFKSAEQLREEFKELIGHLSPNHVVHQCGSGITACHNLFAMELAGLTGSALYPGSWSEWCADPTRPIERAS